MTLTTCYVNIPSNSELKQCWPLTFSTASGTPGQCPGRRSEPGTRLPHTLHSRSLDKEKEQECDVTELSRCPSDGRMNGNSGGHALLTTPQALRQQKAHTRDEGRREQASISALYQKTEKQRSRAGAHRVRSKASTDTRGARCWPIRFPGNPRPETRPAGPALPAAAWADSCPRQRRWEPKATRRGAKTWAEPPRRQGSRRVHLHPLLLWEPGTKSSGVFSCFFILTFATHQW